ncbi:DUF4365 domain-containing protein [Fulvivirgaceae bacterium LMO-SS25]
MEEESFFELKKILPTEWVIREKPKDYGIDVEIEIFNSDGTYTGIVFWIQLKATDSPKEKDHKSIRLSKTKIKQLASYELPVALFRYNSKGKTFYFDWIKRFYYLSSSSIKKSFNIEFQDYNLWSEDSANHLILSLKRNFSVSRGSFSFPVKGFINNVNTSIKTSRKLSAKILEELVLIDVVRDKYKADLEINLMEDRIVLNFSNCYGGSIGYSKEYKNDENYLFSAFKKCLLLILAQTDKDLELFNFIDQNKLLNDIINHTGILQYLMPKLIASESGNHFTQEIVDHVFRFGDVISITKLQTIMLLSSRNIIKQERVEAYFNQIISLSLEHQNKTSLATSYYNFGSYYRSIYVFDRALHYYNRAFKSDCNYLNRGYFCREVASVLFELGFFRLSSKLYKKAIELEPENIFLLATLGDAEFYSGNYEEASNYFNNFLLKNTDNYFHKYEFSLKFTICKTLIELLEKGSQRRNPVKSLEILVSFNQQELQELSKLDEVIEIDALNPVVWSYYSIQCLKGKNLTMVFISNLMQAILIKNESKIWAYLSYLATSEEAYSALLNDIVNTAYFYCKESFILELQKMVEFKDYFRGDEFLNYVEELIKTPREYPIELRYWSDENLTIIEL